MTGYRPAFSDPKMQRFDCLEFKRKAQKEIYEEIKTLSVEEEIAYFERAAASSPFGHFWNELRKDRATSSSAVHPEP